MKISTRRVVMSAIIAALYAVMTVVLNPISFGPLQFRAANLLMALMFFDIDYCFGLALGVFLGNLTSPFGALDWIIMPFVTLLGAVCAYYLRKHWYVGVVVWGIITSAGAAFFPLGIGAKLPFVATFPSILIAQLIAGYGGYLIFSPFKSILKRER